MAKVRVFVRIDIDEEALQDYVDSKDEIVADKEQYIDDNLYYILDKVNYHYNIIDVRQTD